MCYDNGDDIHVLATLSRTRRVHKLSASKKSTQLGWAHQELLISKHRLSPGLCSQCFELLRSHGALCRLIFQCLDNCLTHKIDFQWLFSHSSQETQLLSEEGIELGSDEATQGDWQSEFPTGIVHETWTDEDTPQLGKGGGNGGLGFSFGSNVPGRKNRSASCSGDVHKSWNLLSGRFLGQCNG